MSEKLDAIQPPSGVYGAIAPQPAAGSLPPIGSPPAVFSKAHTLPPQPFARWDNDEFDIRVGITRLGGALLKSQGQVARDLLHRHECVRYMLGCLLLIGFSMCGYGAIMGSFSGAQQAMFAAAKFPLIVLGASAICLPSFYVFQCLMGARLDLWQATLTILLLASAAGLILLACAPIVWFFSMSTNMDSPAFVALLHLAVVLLAWLFGVSFLLRMRRYLAVKRPGERLYDARVFAAWLGMHLLVSAQMASYFGPLLGAGEFFSGERGFFIAAFLKTLAG